MQRMYFDWVRFGDDMRSAIKDLGAKQADLVRDTGIQASTLSQCLQGRGTSMEVTLAICDWTGADPRNYTTWATPEEWQYKRRVAEQQVALLREATTRLV